MGKEMYMKFKNMMTAGTCLVLSAALLAGCGASASETSSESASSEAVAPEETASPEVAEDSYYPVSADTYTVCDDWSGQHQRGLRWFAGQH